MIEILNTLSQKSKIFKISHPNIYEKIEGLSDIELIALEKFYEKKLPALLNGFLQIAGKNFFNFTSAPNLWTGFDLYIVQENEFMLKSYFEYTQLVIDKNIFILTYADDCFFYTDFSSDNPPIYFYVKEEEGYSIEKIFDAFSDMIKYYIKKEEAKNPATIAGI